MREQQVVRAAVRFVTATGLWGLALAVLVTAAGVMAGDPVTAGQVFGRIPTVFGLAMYPAGVAVAPLLVSSSQPWRMLGGIVLAAFVVSGIIMIVSIISPDTHSARGVADLWATMRAGGESWEARNHAAWTLITALLSGPRALLLAGIGVQVGFWAERGVSVALRRPLYWAVAMGLVVSNMVIWDTTYEVVVLHTAADASVAALYTLLLPLSVCAGLGLPTLAMLSQRGGRHV